MMEKGAKSNGRVMCSIEKEDGTLWALVTDESERVLARGI